MPTPIQLPENVERTVRFIEDTAPHSVIEATVAKLKAGDTPKDLLAAAALAVSALPSCHPSIMAARSSGFRDSCHFPDQRLAGWATGARWRLSTAWRSPISTFTRPTWDRPSCRPCRLIPTSCQTKSVSVCCRSSKGSPTGCGGASAGRIAENPLTGRDSGAGARSRAAA